MARLLRAMPELMILVKGISVAARSVFFTLCLLVLIIYVFSIAFTQLAQGSRLEEDYFGSVAVSMNTLLLRGTLPDLADFVNDVGSENIMFSVVLLVFILLSSLTVMNMLVGVLVEVVSVVSSVEKETMSVSRVKRVVTSLLQDTGIDQDGNAQISKDEFELLLLDPHAARILQEIDVDVVGLVDYADHIFADGIEISFPDFMDLLLQLRGNNGATVRDIVDLRKSVYQQGIVTLENFEMILQRHMSDIVGTMTDRLGYSMTKIASALQDSERDRVQNSSTGFAQQQFDTSPSHSPPRRPSRNIGSARGQLPGCPVSMMGPGSPPCPRQTQESQQSNTRGRPVSGRIRPDRSVSPGPGALLNVRPMTGTSRPPTGLQPPGMGMSGPPPSTPMTSKPIMPAFPAEMWLADHEETV